MDTPWVDGVVLIGDSAGYNDPILGQGVSVTARDARMVGEILTQSSDWTSGMFIPYGEERKERLRRLRMVARFVTTLNARFGPEAEITRARGFKRMANNPALRGIALAAFSGPETLDAQYFEEAHWDKVFA